MTDGRLAFAAAVRVVVGVHDRAADGGTGTEVARLARLADADDLMLDVADLTDGRAALCGDEAHLARRHLDGRIAVFACHDLGGDARSTRDLCAAAGLHLDVVHHGTDGDIFESERVAHLDIGTKAARHLVADVEADGSEDVALFAVCIDEEGDVRAAVGIVLDALDRCGDAVLDRKSVV